MRFFDAHTHVHFSAFKDDSKEVIERALKENVWMITVGTQKDTSRQAVEVANMYTEGVYASIGLHPIHTDRAFHDVNELGGDKDASGFTSRGEEFDHDLYFALGKDPKTVAIGECGLDYFRIEGDLEAKKVLQKKAFEAQIALSKELQKPLMVHCRDAFPDLIDMLSASDLSIVNPGVIHFFTGSKDDAKRLLDLGFSFTFGGVVTFTRDYDEAIALIPKENILSETDAPYVAPIPYRGRRNEPAYVINTLNKLAELKGLGAEEMAEQVMGNVGRIFGVKRG